MSLILHFRNSILGPMYFATNFCDTKIPYFSTKFGSLVISYFNRHFRILVWPICFSQYGTNQTKSKYRYIHVSYTSYNPTVMCRHSREGCERTL